MGQGLGGEESSTGHQLLSDYIIPDIKTTHTARVPAGGRERRAGAELGQPRPQANSYFFIRRPPAAEERRPGARAASGRHPASVSCVAGRPGGCAAGAPRGQPVRGRWAGRLRSIPRLRASPVAYLRGVAWRSAPEHIHMVLSPPSSGAAQAAPAAPRRGPGARGPCEAPRGRRRYPRPGSAVPPWRGWRLCVRPGCPRNAPAGGGLAALLTSGRVSEARRAATPPPLRGAPSPPAALLTDGATAPTRRRRRGCSQLLSLMLGLLRIPRGSSGGGTRPETVRSFCPIKGPAEG